MLYEVITIRNSTYNNIVLTHREEVVPSQYYLHLMYNLLDTFIINMKLNIK